VNTCRSHLRRRGIERRLRLDRPLEFVADRPDELSDALRKLTARQRTALVLRFYDDLPEEEIAAVLRVRPATVRSVVRRALAQLREVIPE
jgi:RNA polymerase sigma factor (sigma-70 family)